MKGLSFLASAVLLAGCSQPFALDRNEVPEPNTSDDYFGEGEDTTVYGTVSYDFLRWTLTDVLQLADPVARIALPNPSFETDVTTGWTLVGAATRTMATDPALVADGTGSLRLVVTGAAPNFTNGIRHVAVAPFGPWQPSVTLSFQSRTFDGSSRIVNYRIQALDATSAVLATTTIPAALAGDFRLFSTVGIPLPMNTATVVFEIGNDGTDADIILDAFKLETGPVCRVDTNNDGDTIDETDQSIYPCPLNNPVGYLEANKALLGAPVYSDDPDASQPPSDMGAAGYKSWILSASSACGMMASTNNSARLFPFGTEDFGYAYGLLLGRDPYPAEVDRLTGLQAEVWTASNAPDLNGDSQPDNNANCGGAIICPMGSLEGLPAFDEAKKAAATCATMLTSLEFISEN